MYEIQNIPAFRVVYIRDMGWKVQVRKVRWYGRVDWLDVVTHAGSPRSFYYTSKSRAIQDFLHNVKLKILNEGL